MRLFMFKSESNRELRAFAAEAGAGAEKLPSRHGPWTAVGVVREDKDPPHNMRRELIEKGITDHGFQFYKLKPVEG